LRLSEWTATAGYGAGGGGGGDRWAGASVLPRRARSGGPPAGAVPAAAQYTPPRPAGTGADGGDADAGSTAAALAATLDEHIRRFEERARSREPLAV